MHLLIYLAVIYLFSGVSGGRMRTTPASERDFRSFDYESDFETDEEVGLSSKPDIHVQVYCNETSIEQ